MNYEDEEFTGYDNTSKTNAVATVLFVTGALLFKEGYKSEHIQEIMEKIGTFTGEIFAGRAVITTKGIVPAPKSNVIPIQ